MKTSLGILLLAALLAYVSLLLPTRIRLELYDVQDVTCYMSDWEGITSPTLDPVVDGDELTGEELAGRLMGVLPGTWNGDSDRRMESRNGLLIARTTAAQHLAIRASLAAYRAKTTIWNTLLGIIRR